MILLIISVSLVQTLTPLFFQSPWNPAWLCQVLHPNWRLVIGRHCGRDDRSQTSFPGFQSAFNILSASFFPPTTFVWSGRFRDWPVVQDLPYPWHSNGAGRLIDCLCLSVFLVQLSSDPILSRPGQGWPSCQTTNPPSPSGKDLISEMRSRM